MFIACTVAPINRERRPNVPVVIRTLCSDAALPSIAYVQNNLGVAYERLGHVEEAKAVYSRATALSPRYVKAKINSDRVARVQLPAEEDPLPEDVNAVPETTVP
jgi:hypothetical protein